MKAIQVTIDEGLLLELDSSEEVRQQGRSAVIRRATREYLRRKKRREIEERYLRGYANDDLVSEELAGWTEEGVWPED